MCFTQNESIDKLRTLQGFKTLGEFSFTMKNQIKITPFEKFQTLGEFSFTD